MLNRTFLFTMAALVGFGGSLSAQDLDVYDPQGFSGGYAEGSYGPLGSEQLYPYDSQDPWMHGYIQYMPFYGAYKHFRPYNYKQVGPQVQTAAGWGMNPRTPYSQQFWHRYHARGTMSNGYSNAQEALMQYPQPNLFQRRVEQNRAPQNPNPLNYYPEYPPQQYPSQQFVPEPAPQPYGQPPMTTYPGNGGINLQAPQPYSGVSYQTGNAQPQYGQQPILMVP